MKNTFWIAVEAEYKKARQIYAPLHSTHEGIAVIQEEVDELWELVKKNKGTKITGLKMVKECIQIAAMVYAFVNELDEDSYLKLVAGIQG